ncbi:hypothetical protein BWI96_18340 [Siphonobacter sp. SORGH_AS_0500]|uniref:hypothetical protein n=1 Tax=Siphonobacter sp. SORGH_AS_0500 TaxID=1864824 RepID=UPI000CB22880|nr:hypothetical protein [Siphonobacter sp. SORGH_AS_0500]PKK35170.1 hypothetical protein BWI96_18340 [Siphonobacter sp. SORGH_AS_0500]
MLLRAGNLTLLYHEGSLRYFTINDQEILRRIYVAIRDENWGTADITIQDERIEPSEDTFKVYYRWTTDEPKMAGEVTITGEADGTVTFDWQGTALEDFSKNRLGLCILHPIEGFKNQIVRVIHPNGEETPSTFPDLILPHQPFMTVAGLEWHAINGLKAQLQLEGDIFETEDQRNYSDTSYKTYATPQSLPKPVAVSKGEVFQQKAFLSFSGEWPLYISPNPNVRVDLAGESQPLAKWGLCWPKENRTLTEKEIELLRKLSPSHIRLELDLTEKHWQETFFAAFREIEKLNIPILLAVLIDLNAVPDLNVFKSKSLIKEVVLLNENGLTTNELLEQALPLLESRWPTLRMGGGTTNFFVEFNRNPFEYARVDFVSYSICPQVHCFDEVSIVENLAGQAETVRSAIQLSEKPVQISPVRFADQTDERLQTPFAASWTIGSYKYLAEAGAEAITYYDLFGPDGIIYEESPTPVYELFAFLSEFKPEQLIPSRTSQPLRCSSLILEKANGWKTTLIANHTDETFAVRLPGAVVITLKPYEWRSIF